MAVAGLDDLSSSGTTQAAGPLGPWTWSGIGAATATPGLLPWLVTGARLPLQNLWGASTVPEEIPIGLLPGGCPPRTEPRGRCGGVVDIRSRRSRSGERARDPDDALGFLQWLPAILCGSAIAWCGIDTIGRVSANVLGVAATVIGPAFGTAVSSAAGTRVLARYPLEILDHGARVLQAVLDDRPDAAPDRHRGRRRGRRVRAQNGSPPTQPRPEVMPQS